MLKMQMIKIQILAVWKFHDVGLQLRLEQNPYFNFFLNG